MIHLTIHHSKYDRSRGTVRSIYCKQMTAVTLASEIGLLMLYSSLYEIQDFTGVLKGLIRILIRYRQEMLLKLFQQPVGSENR